MMPSPRRRPSLLIIWFMVLMIFVIEVELVLNVEPRNTKNVRRMNIVREGETPLNDCVFLWKSASCSPGCCIQTHSRHGVPPSICEPCHEGSFSVVVQHQLPSISYHLFGTIGEDSEGANLEEDGDFAILPSSTDSTTVSQSKDQELDPRHRDENEQPLSQNIQSPKSFDLEPETIAMKTSGSETQGESTNNEESLNNEHADDPQPGEERILSSDDHLELVDHIASISKPKGRARRSAVDHDKRERQGQDVSEFPSIDSTGQGRPDLASEPAGGTFVPGSQSEVSFGDRGVSAIKPTNSKQSPSEYFVMRPVEAFKRSNKLLCWTFTARVPSQLFNVKRTWGKRCDKLLLFGGHTIQEKSTLSISFAPKIREMEDLALLRPLLVWKYVYAKYRHSFDWFLRADTDTFVVVENLRSFLQSDMFNSSDRDPFYVGRRFRFLPSPPVEGNGTTSYHRTQDGNPLSMYNLGRSGYVLNANGLEVLICAMDETCKGSYPEQPRPVLGKSPRKPVIVSDGMLGTILEEGHKPRLVFNTSMIWDRRRCQSPSSKVSLQSSAWGSKFEDQVVACLLYEGAGVEAVDSADDQGRERFNTHSYSSLLANRHLQSQTYRKLSLNQEPFPMCCSPDVISFHRADLVRMERKFYAKKRDMNSLNQGKTDIDVDAAIDTSSDTNTYDHQHHEAGRLYDYYFHDSSTSSDQEREDDPSLGRGVGPLSEAAVVRFDEPVSSKQAAKFQS